MEAGRVPNDGIIQVEIRKAIPTQLLPGQIVMYQVSESVGVLYKGNPDGSVSLDDTSTDIRLPNGTATKLFLKWNNTSGLFEARTKVEFISDIQTEGSATDIFYWWNEDEEAWEAITKLEMLNLLIPEGTPVNAVAASGTLTAGDIPTATKTVTIGSVTYTFVEALSTEPTVANEILIEVSASATLDNLISAINASAGAGTKYGTGTVIHPTVSAAAGDGDTVNLTAKTKGVAGNSIATTTNDSNLSFGALTLEGGINGTVGSKYDMYKDASYIYIAIDANTATTANWRRIALGTAY